MRIIGIRNYSDDILFTCSNCIACSSWAREIREDEEHKGYLCGTCDEPLGFFADEASAYREAHGRLLVAQEEHWLMVDSAHDEALEWLALQVSDFSFGPLVEEHKDCEMCGGDECLSDSSTVLPDYSHSVHCTVNRWPVYRIRGIVR